MYVCLTQHIRHTMWFSAMTSLSNTAAIIERLCVRACACVCVW